MKRVLAVALISGMCLWSSCAPKEGTGCRVGAFLADKPSVPMIEGFQKDFGKKPGLILTFLDWGKFPDKAVVSDVYATGGVLMVTWEPWHAAEKKAIDYDALLKGREDAYIREFALKLKAIGKPVFLRFAHEMNGDWYPWSGQKIGAGTYVKMFRHIREVFDEADVRNVRWVFSINAENVPSENPYTRCYPGDRYVDYLGLDGYNWGMVRGGGVWRSFKDIFFRVYKEVVRRYNKPVILSEFSSTSAGGDKALWIEEALQTIKRMPAVKGFILFDVEKETDWQILPDTSTGQKLKAGLKDPYFTEAWSGDLA